MRAETVLCGRDSEALAILLNLHGTSAPLVLDCTYNTGKMWKTLNYQPIRLDINSSLRSLDVIGDFHRLPFATGTFDVVVFDPPHLPTNIASKNSSRIWEKQYGLTDSGYGRDGDNVIPLFLPFLQEASRVLKTDGIVLAKIADIVHNHRYQWQQVGFVIAARGAGMTPCDMLIKRDPCGGNMKSSKWKNVKHLRKTHCYWIVVRNSKRCEKR